MLSAAKGLLVVVLILVVVNLILDLVVVLDCNVLCCCQQVLACGRKDRLGGCPLHQLRRCWTRLAPNR